MAALAPSARRASLALPPTRRARRRVAGRGAAGSRAGGGEEIQAPRPLGARLATAAGALVVAVLVAVPALGEGPGDGSLVFALGGGALFCLAAGLAVRRGSLLVA